MHLVGFLLILNYDARNHEIKITLKCPKVSICLTLVHVT